MKKNSINSELSDIVWHFVMFEGDIVVDDYLVGPVLHYFKNIKVCFENGKYKLQKNGEFSDSILLDYYKKTAEYWEKEAERYRNGIHNLLNNEEQII